MKNFVLIVAAAMMITGEAHSQTAPDSPALELESRLDQIERSLASLRSDIDKILNSETYLKQKGEIDLIQKNLQDLQFKLAADQLSFSGNYFGILGTLLAIAAIVAGLAGVLIYEVVSRTAASSVKAQVDGAIAKRVPEAMDATICEAFARFAFAWWMMYEDDMQRLLRDPFFRANVSQKYNVEAALLLAEEGIELFEKNQLSKAADGSQALAYIRFLLANHWVYHKTAALLFNRRETGVEPDQPQKDALVEKAKDLIKLVKDGPGRPNLWYEAWESAIFALRTFGDPADQTRGRRLLVELFAREAPDAAPVEWLQELYDRLQGRGDDLHGIARP